MVNFIRGISTLFLLVLISYGGWALVLFWEQELIARQLTQWEPVLTDDYRLEWDGEHAELLANYQYTYQEKTYKGHQFSPFPRLNQEAYEDERLRNWIIRDDHPPLTVYVDPGQPARSSLASGWAQGERENALIIGMVGLSVGIILLYFILRPAVRVVQLFD